MAAMYAGLGLGLGRGLDHTDQGTRNGPISRCWFQIDGEQSTFRNTDGVQFEVTLFAPTLTIF